MATGLFRRIGLCVLLIAGIAMPDPHWNAPAAWADDHGDDDDDGGGGATASGGGGGSGDDPRPVVKKKKQRAKAAVVRKPVAVAVRPARERFVIVASGLTSSTREALQAQGYEILSEAELQSLPGRNVARLKVPRGRTIEAARAEVAALSAALVADLNHYYRPQAFETCEGRDCSIFTLVNWRDEDARNCGLQPQISIVDTAVNISHKVLAASNIESVTMRRSGLPPSGNSHGTAVASILVGSNGSRIPGLLPSATLVAVDPYHRGEGNDDRVDVYDLVRAIDFLVSRRPNAINLSLSGPENALLAKAISTASEARIPVVAAAGNGGPGARPLYPAAYDGVIAVTAIDSRKGVYRRAAQGDHIDLAAPGVGVWTAAGTSGVKQSSGTSFATPFVTAAVALINFAGPGAGEDEVLARLAPTAIDLGKAGKDATFGHGLMQAGNLCAKVQG